MRPAVATRKQKQQLLEVLKHGVQKYSIHLTGYGGEIVVGEITPAQYQYWQDHDLDAHASDWDNEMDVPESLRLCEDGAWYDCDSIAHETGVEFSNLCYVTVYDHNDSVVWQSPLGADALEEAGLEPHGFCCNEIQASDSTATHAFMGQNIEKGTFFTGEFETVGLFDPCKLSFSVIEIEGWPLVNGVSYASEIIDDTGGYSTWGKGMEFKVFEVKQ